MVGWGGGRRGRSETTREAPRGRGREDGRLDIACAWGAIFEIIDIARQAEVRIQVELAARRNEEIIALVLDPVQPADRRQLRREQLALVVTDADAVSPAGEARRQRRLDAAAAILR